VTEQPGPLPQRIGDAERDKAVEYLRDHLAEGRLDQWEFDERLTKALTAKTQADLDPLFRDLPGPKPGAVAGAKSPFQAPPWQTAASRSMVPRPTPPVPTRAQRGGPLSVASSLAWPIVIVAIIAMGGNGLWWLISIPIILSILAKQNQPPGPHRR
jgi:hypothetical protein